MGFKVLPGHQKDGGNRGWQPTATLEQIVKEIPHGNGELNWYKTLDENDSDTVKAYYSIPSPFATAYLFKEVMSDANHELSLEVIELILCMLYDIYKGEAKLEYIPKPENDQPFFNFWKNAPDFIKYGDKLPVFVKGDKIIGGLSKYSIVWATPNYKPLYIIQNEIPDTIKSKDKNFIAIDKNDKDTLIGYLKYIQNMKFPEDNCERFWGDPRLTRILNGIEPLSSSLYKTVNNDNAPWLIVRKEFLESGLISLKYLDDINETEHKNNFGVMDSANKILYPLKPESLNAFFHEKGIAEFRSTDTGDLGFVDLTIHNTKHELKNVKVNKCYRSIAIWPPFESKFTEVFVMELIPPANDRKIDQIPLEFYDNYGNNLECELILLEEENLSVKKLYKLKNKGKFPHFIRLNNIDHENKQARGMLAVKPRKIKQETSDKLKIAIDFGSSHTTVAYKEECMKEAKNMLFSNCRPIFIGTEDSMRILLEKFIPDMLIDKIPANEKEFEKNRRNWLPFRTLFYQFSEQKYSFLESGVIPLYGSIGSIGDFVSRGVYKKNIKWTAKTHLREGFLNYLTTISLVEVEGMGYRADNLQLFWSYPRAFSTSEEQTITNYWQKKNTEFQNMLGISNDIIVSNGVTESVAAMEYFNRYGKLAMSKDKLALTIDIGGGTSDFSFFGVNDKHQTDLKIQDSIKFAGGDLAKCIKNIVITRLNQLLKNEKFKVDQDYDELMRSWPCVKYDWDTHIGNFKLDNTDYPLFEEIVTLFYGSLCFFAGMHLKALGQENIKLNQIAFGGNGSQFFRYFTMGNDPNKQLKFLKRFTDLFKKLAAAGQGIEESSYQELEFMFTSHPKQEVAFGLLESDPKKVFSDNCNQKLFGLTVTLDNQTITWDKWEERLNGNKLTAEQISTADFDFSEFEKFLNKFYELFNELDCFKDHDIHRELSDFGGFENSFRHRVSQRKSESLATPLFFSALTVWLEYLGKAEVESNEYDNGVDDVDE